jgi:hypothetical protein
LRITIRQAASTSAASTAAGASAYVRPQTPDEQVAQLFAAARIVREQQ